MEIVENKALLLRTRTPHKVTEVIVKSKDLGEQEDGLHEVAVHWGLRECQALVRVGAKNVPSPIIRDYGWSGRLTPYEHQKTTSSFLTLHPRAFCFNEAGTGKTASVIWAVDYLMQLGLVRRVLVVCPLSIMKPAWQRDLFKFAMHRSCVVAHGTSKARRKAIEERAEFTIINYDGIGVVFNELAAAKFDMIVIDEGTAYKNCQTNRWKLINRLATNVSWLWLLTGTPGAQSPLDAYGLAKLVCPERAPKYYGQYRDMVMYKLSQFIWRPKMTADKTVHSMLQPAIRFAKKDCLDLPSVVIVSREAPLTPQQDKYYKLLKKQMAMEAGGESVTAVNAAVNVNKLLQISGGAVYSDDKAVVEFDVSNRLNVVLEVIEETSNKVLVFVPFTHTIELLKTFLDKNKITSEIISGAVNANKRADIFDAFQTKTDPKVLIIQPQAAAHGVTLTAADTVIWYAPVTSVETYLQANARIDRPGQKNNMTIVNIVGSEVEEKLYTMLQSNINNHNKIVELYRQEIEQI